MNRFTGSVALISGTAIGAGMLTLPVAMAPMGFLPSLFLFGAAAAIMAYVALLILEVLVVLPANSTMISMVSGTLGPAGKNVAILSYFFLLTALNVAYLSGASVLIMQTLGVAGSSSLYRSLVITLACSGAWLATAPTQKIDSVNRVLVIALMGCYIALILVSLPHVKVALLKPRIWTEFAQSPALVLTSFGYHLIIPNIFDYLNRDITKTRKAILLGTFIPWVVYTVWQMVVMGIVPQERLLEALSKSMSATIPLANQLNSLWLQPVCTAFAILAILTSFLGTMMAFCEFLIDTLRCSNSAQNRLKFACLSAVPLVTLCLFRSDLFIRSLKYAGLWACILVGCLPILVAALSRRNHPYSRDYLVWGGYPLMAIAFTGFLVIIVTEIFKHIG